MMLRCFSGIPAGAGHKDSKKGTGRKMIHPSYVDLMHVVNKGVEEGETPVINSRYSIVMATAKRARQIVDGDEPLIHVSAGEKPLSIAVEELNQEKIHILADNVIGEEAEEEDFAELTGIENDFEETEETVEEAETSDEITDETSDVTDEVSEE